MTITFDQPIGAAADSQELEYIAALYQSCMPTVRSCGTIHAEDIGYHFMSRYSVRVNPELIENRILKDVTSNGILDLAELVSVLLTPNLLKAREEGEQGLFEQVLTVLLQQIPFQQSGGEPAPRVLTVETLKMMLESSGETSLHGNTKLLQEMVDLATCGKGGEVNSDTFSHALTADVRDVYSLSWQDRQSTHFEDAISSSSFAAPRGKETAKKRTEEKNKEKASNVDAEAPSEPPYEIQNIFTSPSIDQTADLYQSQILPVLLWVTLVVTYFAYFYSFTASLNRVNCKSSPEDNASFGCLIKNGIVNWIIIFGQLTGLGAPFVYIGSMGNGAYSGQARQNRTLLILQHLVSMATVSCMTILPFSFEYQSKFINTKKRPGYEIGYYLSIIFGIFIVIIKLLQLIQTILRDDNRQSGTTFLSKYLLTPGILQREQRIKMAAAFKTNRIILNALGLHTNNINFSDSRNNDKNKFLLAGGLSKNEALLRYQTNEDETKKSGGIIWTWRNRKRLLQEEGIWIHSRVLACNLAQFVIIAFILFEWAYFSQAAQGAQIPETPPSTTDIVLEAAGGGLRHQTGLHRSLQNPDSTGSPFPLYDPSIPCKDQFNDDFWYGGLLGDDDSWKPCFINGMGEAGTGGNQGGGSGSPWIVNGGEETGNASSGEGESWTSDSGGGSTFVSFTDDQQSWGGATSGDDNFFTVSGNDSGEEETGTPQWQINFAVSMGALSGILAASGIAVVFVPSYISSVLKFRSGFFPSLKSKDFLQYRFAQDQSTILFGSAFWGSLYTAGIIALVIGGISFAIVYKGSRQFVLTIVAQTIGLLCTILVKVVVLCVLRRKFYAAFHRKRTGVSNVLVLILESWDVALSTGYMLGRSTKLLLVAVWYIGRIDAPLLAGGAGYVGTVPLDAYPVAFRKNILQIESTRHPYIERVGQLFLLKLIHGKGFISRAGATWRLLFVLTLMPWVRKWRINVSKDADLTDSEDFTLDSDDDGGNGGNTSIASRRPRNNYKKTKHLEKIESREQLLDEEVQLLREKNRKLKKKLAQYKSKLDAM